MIPRSSKCAFRTLWDAVLRASWYRLGLLRSAAACQFFAAEKKKADARQELPGAAGTARLKPYFAASIVCKPSNNSWEMCALPLARCLLSMLCLGNSCRGDSAGRWQVHGYLEVPPPLWNGALQSGRWWQVVACKLPWASKDRLWRDATRKNSRVIVLFEIPVECCTCSSAYQASNSKNCWFYVK